MRDLGLIWEPHNRTRVYWIAFLLVAGLAFIDWLTKPYISLGFLYLFPIMLVAGFIPRWAIVVLAVVCALLSEAFSALDPSDAPIRLIFETLALAGCGLFVSEMSRNRRLTLEAQERLRVFVETSPAAIVTIDERGFIELANRAAIELIAPRDGKLVGHPIAAYLPGLHHALRREDGPQFRASMQCRAHRDSGEAFEADVYFSTYKEGAVPKLAAIIAGVTDDAVSKDSKDDNSSRTSTPRPSLGSREVQVLRLVVQGLSNKEIAVHMELSESSIKNTLQQLFAKTGIRTRGQLVRVALEEYRDLL